MRKVSTAAANEIRNFSEQKLTIGLDLGDRSSWYCVLDATGEVVLEQRLSTTAKAMKEVFRAMPRSRIALETGMHSPWVSRGLSELGHEVIVAHARNVRLIGESRKKDDRLDARTLARLARIRSAVVVSGETSQRQSPGGLDCDPGASRAGAGADRTDQHGARTGEVLRRAAARLQPAERESGESERTESGTAIRAGTAAGSRRIAQRTDPRIQRRDRAVGAAELSASGAAETGEGGGDADSDCFKTVTSHP